MSRNEKVLKDKSIFELTLNENVLKEEFDCSIENKPFLNEHQGKTSYCWIYASVAMLKEYMYKKYNLEDYDFSYAYLEFYDKYEKMKWIIEEIYKKKYTESGFENSLKFASSDKGGFEIFVSLINKYGIVPRSDMQDTYSVKNSRNLNHVLHNYLINLINAVDNDSNVSMQKAIGDIHDLLIDCYGKPPSNIQVNINKEEIITPLDFYNKYLNKYLDEYISIANFTDEDEYINKYCCYKQKYNFVTKNKIKCINLKEEQFNKAIISQLLEHATYISMKIGDGDIKAGIFDDKLYKLNELLDINIELDKKSIMKYKDDMSVHALLLVGVDIKDIEAEKWKVKDNNPNIGREGYFILSKSWFKKYVCSIVVNKKHLPKMIMGTIDDVIIDIF